MEAVSEELSRCPISQWSWVGGFRQWLDVFAAPTEVLESVSCVCKKCVDRRCSCKKNGLTCTGACKCTSENCTNSKDACEDFLESADESDDD